MSLTKKQLELAKQSQPEDEAIRRHFREPLELKSWQQLVSVVTDRLIGRYGKRLVVNGIVFRVGGLVWWDRQAPPNLKPEEPRWPIVLYHDGAAYIPDALLHIVSYAQFGLPLLNTDRWYCFKTRLHDLQELGHLYYDVKFAVEDHRRLEELAESGTHSEEVIQILKRAKKPDNPRATRSAEDLSLACHDLLKALELAVKCAFDSEALANLAFKVGEAYTELQHVRDKRLMEQNKRGKTMSGGQPGDARAYIRFALISIHKQTGSLPNTKELLMTTYFDVEKRLGRITKITFAETEITMSTFYKHLRAERRAMGEPPRGRGRPKKK